MAFSSPSRGAASGVLPAPDRIRIGRRFDEPPGVGSSRILRGERRVQRVAAAMRDEVADHRMADEREVADDVEDLVAHELVVEPQRVIQHARFAENDRVVERSAEREAALPQHLDFLQEPERPRRSNLLDEALLVDLHRPRLVPEQRMVEADAVSDLQMFGRIERDALVTLRERDRTNDFQVAARRLQPLDPRLVEDQSGRTARRCRP